MTTPLLCCVMGATGAGKSTLLRTAMEMAGDTVGLVEVGKVLRAKYGDDYFNGQAAPAHTAGEAWTMFVDGVAAYAAAGKRLIMVDGQPRDYKQCEDIMDLPYNTVFVNLYAPIVVREHRLMSRDAGNEKKLALSRARLHGDLPMLYELISILESRGKTVWHIRTDTPHYQPEPVVAALQSMQAAHE